MKKYIVLTFNVCNMGGGQLFVLRRSLYLKNKGFDVHVITTFDNGVFPLKESFEGIPIYNIPEMASSSSFVSEKRQKEILSNVIQKIGKADEYYLESHTLGTIEWAELLSAKLHGRHLAYPLAEPLFNKQFFYPGKSIILNKLERNQLYCNNSRSLVHIFGKEPKQNLFINIAFDETELKVTCSPSLNYKKQAGDYVITTVTRLDKTYVEPFIEDIKKLALKYPTQQYVMIVAGGSNTGTREKDLLVKYSKSDIANLKIVFTGYIKELGKDIFNVSDVFVGMGTASINAISQRCIALNIDPSRNNMCSGIFGIDTNNFGYTENGKVYTIFEKIEEIYLADENKKNYLKKVGRELFETSFEINSCFLQMDAAINSISESQDEPCLYVSKSYRFVVRLSYKLLAIIKKTIISNRI